MMGCSTSMVDPVPAEKQPVVCRNDILKGHVYLSGQTVKGSDLDISISKGNLQFKENDKEMKKLNQSDTDGPQIFDPSRTMSSTDAVDTTKVVPHFNDGENPSPIIPVCYHNTMTSYQVTGRVSRSQSLPAANLRSVLKTSLNQNMLRNRPIKTVTFMEPVAVVTVR